ncbi:hypothetical protein LAG90_05865 [Marinilongibacter aquaticus]|uniref:hypothetical protein n=1 Tax=Marinilongibacter aquaticus TaxID=2975157 RepID=UPI0021BD4425|nr:hypothetical protein [Marinilongibacter aquaticus]UBM60167.1 hypothetical protein LAG90_05865 [Marinilongibacter aquaticus]
MDSEKEKWINDVLQSMKGSRKAKPSARLFEQIESKIDSTEAKVVPLYFWRSVAAAVLLLCLNIFAFQHLNAYRKSVSNTQVETASYSADLISDFNIYR